MDEGEVAAAGEGEGEGDHRRAASYFTLESDECCYQPEVVRGVFSDVEDPTMELEAR